VLFAVQEFTSCGGKKLHKNQISQFISTTNMRKAKLKSGYLHILTIDKTTKGFECYDEKDAKPAIRERNMAYSLLKKITVKAICF